MFCEKPLAASVVEAEEALDAVEQPVSCTAIDFLFPEITAWQQAKSLLGRA